MVASQAKTQADRSVPRMQGTAGRFILDNVSYWIMFHIG